MKRLWLIVILVVGFMGGAARAAGLMLPASLRVIEAHAFEGDAAVREVEIPENVIEICECAFQDCIELGKVYIGQNIQNIGDGAFDNCAEDILICTQKGSTAVSYAVRNQLDYQAGTVYRVLLIGNSYSQNRELRLFGPENDVKALKQCLMQFSETPYEIYTRLDQTVEEMLQSIESIFGGASAEDVSWLYFSGHGILMKGEETQSALLGNDSAGTLTAEALRKVMDAIPGRKVIVIDACYSGGFINTNDALSISMFNAENLPRLEMASDDTQDTASAAQKFSEGFISEFSTMSKQNSRNGVDPDCYFILTSAASDELSYEGLLAESSMGYFTRAFVEGCGWDVINSMRIFMSADKNENGVITFDELFQHTKDNLTVNKQHVQAWPHRCSWFGLLRN